MIRLPGLALALLASVAAAQDTVTIDYPDEMPLVGLVDYASQSLDVRIIYGDELQGKSVVLRPSPITLPKDRLLDLVRSVLRMKGLALVADELEGFYRVVPDAELQRVVSEIREAGPLSEVVPGRVVTQAIVVPSGDTKRVAPHLKAFMSSAQASVIEVPQRGLVVVTDYEPAVARLMRLVELIDAAPPEVTTRIVSIEHADPSDLAAKIELILEPQARQPAGAGVGVRILPDVVPASLVVIGTQEQIAGVEQLVARLDVRSEDVAPTRTYSPQYISAVRLSSLVEGLILGTTGERASARLLVDEATNRLYVTAPDSVHGRISRLIGDEDRPLPPSSRRLRIYRPRNRSAGEILDTLTYLLEEATVVLLEEQLRTTQSTAPGGPTGPNRPPARPGAIQIPPMPPAQEPIEEISELSRPSRRVEGPDYVLTEDAHTNSILAIGTPEFHAQLAELIEELDQRRPQVLIEMTLVAVSLSDSLDLGVELEALELGDGWDHLLFSSFGLSSIDVSTGQRVLAPGVGANGVLLRPDEASIVLRALATHGNSRLMSTPRILVSDNATGTIRGVDEAPFTSINASDTVATTTFAGFESAGTTLTVTPHVAEGDHLLLDYTLTFSSFSGSSSSATAPPPRSTNSFSSIVEVPDGYTVIVGGLIVENEADTVSEVPLLGRIPIIGVAFQSSTVSTTRSRVFAFIRPVILRDDQFEDLKYLSEAQLEAAELENPDFPPDVLMWMR